MLKNKFYYIMLKLILFILACYIFIKPSDEEVYKKWSLIKISNISRYTFILYEIKLLKI
jgi:hypothetical protein